jgi:hypothetical protein
MSNNGSNNTDYFNYSLSSLTKIEKKSSFKKKTMVGPATRELDCSDISSDASPACAFKIMPLPVESIKKISDNLKAIEDLI